MTKVAITLTLLATLAVLGACTPPADTSGTGNSTGAGSATTASSSAGGATMSSATAASGDSSGAGQSAAVPASGDGGAGAVVHVDQKASGSTVSIVPGQRVAITLTANPTTGYTWNVVTAPDPAVLKQVSADYSTPSSQLMGAGGTQTWLYEGVASGTTNLKLSYFRTFSPTERGGDFELTVVVK